MRKEEVEEAPNVAMGDFSIKTHPVEVLFDYGVMYSYTSAKQLVSTM